MEGILKVTAGDRNKINLGVRFDIRSLSPAIIFQTFKSVLIYLKIFLFRRLQNLFAQGPKPICKHIYIDQHKSTVTIAVNFFKGHNQKMLGELVEIQILEQNYSWLTHLGKCYH